MVDKRYEILCSGNACNSYPVITVFGLLWYEENEAIEIPKCFPFKGEWGQVLSSNLLLQEEHPMPFKLNLMWMSITENKFFEIETKLPVDKMVLLWEKYKENGKSIFSHIVVGMAPLGKTSLWLHGFKKSILVLWENAQEISYEVELSAFPPAKECFESRHYFRNFISKIQDNYISLAPYDLFDNYMKQFTYRYLVDFAIWKKDNNLWQEYSENNKVMPELDYIEEALYDGTHDKLHDGGLLNYHQAGKPKKLSVAWHINKSEYTAYFWFEDEAIRNVFDRFYGAHPDTKTDFMIRIDAEKNKYELALYRYGLKEPQVISESVYQLLVFKNKFECYRSENYNQPRGAWIW